MHPALINKLEILTSCKPYPSPSIPFIGYNNIAVGWKRGCPGVSCCSGTCYVHKILFTRRRSLITSLQFYFGFFFLLLNLIKYLSQIKPCQNYLLEHLVIFERNIWHANIYDIFLFFFNLIYSFFYHIYLTYSFFFLSRCSRFRGGGLVKRWRVSKVELEICV